MIDKVQRSSVGNEMTLSDIAKILRRRRLTFVMGVVICVALASAVCVLKHRRYQASGTLEVQKESSDMLNLMEMMGSAGGDEDALAANIALQTQAQILNSDSLALRAIKDLNLESTIDFASRKSSFTAHNAGVDAGKGIDDSPERRERAVAIFRKNLSVRVLPGTRIIQISYTSRDPKLAAAVVNHLMQDLVSFTVETRFKATSQASEWLSGQMGELKKQAQDLQAKLAELRRESGVYSLGADSTGKEMSYSAVLDSLQQTTSALAVSESNRIVKGAVYQVVRSGDPELISGLTGPSLAGSSQSVAESMQLLQNLRGQQATISGQVQQLEAKFGPNYPKLIELKRSKASIDSAIKDEAMRIAERAKNDYEIAQRTEAQNRALYAEKRKAADDLNSKAIEYAILKQEADTSRGLYDDLLKRLKEAGVIEGLRSTNLTVIDMATVPFDPSSPKVPLILTIGILGGLFVGLTSAFLVDTLQAGIHSADQLEDLGLTVLGILPEFGSKRIGKQVGGDVDKRPFQEGLRAVMASLSMLRRDQRPKVILVTSSIPGEGKTEVAVNLASLYAKREDRVLLVECDMRRPSVRKRLSLPTAGGLSSILSGNEEQATLQSDKTNPSLTVLLAGANPPNPSELLNSSMMRSRVEQWRQEYDVVILDSPPLLPVADTAALVPLADATLLVVRANRSSRPSVTRSVKILRQLSNQPIATVLNFISPKSSSYYSYYGYSAAAYGTYEEKEA